MSRWFRSTPVGHTTLMVAAEEDQHLQSAEQALLKLLNDDIVGADEMLREQDSSYHYLGRGISSFIASVLGAEKELLKVAAATLQKAETKAWENMKIAQKEPTAFRSQIYPPGTEYLLCYCVAQLTSAITAVMGGSIAEAIKGCYKLRRAYLTLESILEVESNYLKKMVASKRSSVASRKDLSRGSSRQKVVNTPPSTRNGSSSEISKTLLAGDPANSDAIAVENHSLASAFLDTEPTPDQSQSNTPTKIPSRLDLDPGVALGVFTNHTDIFIHSGTRLCYGLLLIVVSMIQNPVFNRILYIVGFKGDRERGAQLLWQSTRFTNFNSAIAGIALLGYYNGIVGFCDILPADADAEDDISGYPKARCKALLSDMRSRYPNSKLWKFEEARSYSYNRNLGAAMKILTESSDSKLKQVAAITAFELGLTSMFIHDFALCAESWLKCSELSAWSPTMYAYLTGCAHVELYRDLRNIDPAAAQVHKETATEYIRKGPPLAGRQKIMSKQLPFDVYIVRKVQKWEGRAKAWAVDLVDAIGTSPLAEMMHHWNGIERMGPEQLDKTLHLLQWQRTVHPARFTGDVDELAIQGFLRARVLRSMGRFEDARGILQNEILNHDRQEFKGHLKDDWTLPSANYEMACLAWDERDMDGVDRTAKVLECEKWLDKTQKWGEAYVLDARMSLKVMTGQSTLKRHKNIMGI